MIISDASSLPAVAGDAPVDGRAPADGIARLRHDLRNHVNQILGYGELLIEEIEANGRPGPLDGLRSIRARGRQVLALINDGLPGEGAGETGAAIDLPALRLRMLEPLGRIIADCERLDREADDPPTCEFRADVARIRAGAARLAEMADAMLAGWPPAGVPTP